MVQRAVFVFLDLGETLVSLRDLVSCIAKQLRAEFPRVSDVAPDVAHDWIRRTSDSLPRDDRAPFVREIEIASLVLKELILARGITVSTTETEALLRRSWDDFEELVRFCPGISEEWLDGLHHIAAGTGIVTDGDSVNVDRLVKRLRLDRYFDTIITSEAVRAYKPNPRIYLAALRTLGAEPDRSLFVSDTALDLVGAAEVGMRTALLRRDLLTEAVDLPRGSLRLSSPSELSAVLRKSTK